jgi:hypothetical protein
MTYQTEQRTDERTPRETTAKPPPQAAGRSETVLFQGMDELHVRHGNTPTVKDRVYLWGGGLLIGSLLFGMLYVMILFLEY